MSDTFVPFFSGPDREARTDSRFEVLVVPQSGGDSAEVSLPGTATAAATAAPVPVPRLGSHGTGCASGSPSQEPEIVLDREGDRIVRITIRCSCGQVLELNCTY